MRFRRPLLPVHAIIGAAASLVAGSAMVWAQMATADRVQGTGFWPTQGRAARSEFLGPDACARCHVSHAESQQRTSMAQTAMPAKEAPTLRDNATLRFRSGEHTYEVTTSGGQSRYSVTGPDGTASVPLEWAFGAGKVGQTYLFEKDGVIQEGRLSYFESLHGADFTPGRAVKAPKDLAEALSRPVHDAESRRCFGCHTTASTAAGVFDTKGLIAGVTCEACHGPGRRHVEALATKRVGVAVDAIFNPARLDPAASVDYCGACHATFWDVKLAGEQGLAALRSQPNRLQSSKCWGEGDARITCVACHDPHQPLVREAAAYDSRCSSCHVQPTMPSGAAAQPTIPSGAAVQPTTPSGAAVQTGSPTRSHPGRACPVARQDCVTCHMPKYDAPGMHHQFTDHLIRVVAAKK